MRLNDSNPKISINEIVPAASSFSVQLKPKRRAHTQPYTNTRHWSAASRGPCQSIKHSHTSGSRERRRENHGSNKNTAFPWLARHTSEHPTNLLLLCPDTFQHAVKVCNGNGKTGPAAGSRSHDCSDIDATPGDRVPTRNAREHSRHVSAKAFASKIPLSFASPDSREERRICRGKCLHTHPWTFCEPCGLVNLLQQVIENA